MKCSADGRLFSGSRQFQVPDCCYCCFFLCLHIWHGFCPWCSCICWKVFCDGLDHPHHQPARSVPEPRGHLDASCSHQRHKCQKQCYSKTLQTARIPVIRVCNHLWFQHTESNVATPLTVTFPSAREATPLIVDYLSQCQRKPLLLLWPLPVPEKALPLTVTSSSARESHSSYCDLSHCQKNPCPLLWPLPVPEKATLLLWPLPGPEKDTLLLWPLPGPEKATLLLWPLPGPEKWSHKRGGLLMERRGHWLGFTLSKNNNDKKEGDQSRPKCNNVVVVTSGWEWVQDWYFWNRSVSDYQAQFHSFSVHQELELRVTLHRDQLYSQQHVNQRQLSDKLRHSVLFVCYFQDKLYIHRLLEQQFLDEVLSSLWDALEGIIVKVPVALPDVVQRLHVIFSSKWWETTQPGRSEVRIMNYGGYRSCTLTLQSEGIWWSHRLPWILTKCKPGHPQPTCLCRSPQLRDRPLLVRQIQPLPWKLWQCFEDPAWQPGQSLSSWHWCSCWSHTGCSQAADRIRISSVLQATKPYVDFDQGHLNPNPNPQLADIITEVKRSICWFPMSLLLPSPVRTSGFVIQTSISKATFCPSFLKKSANCHCFCFTPEGMLHMWSATYRPWCPNAQCCFHACASVPRTPVWCSWSPLLPSSCSPRQQCGQTAHRLTGCKAGNRAQNVSQTAVCMLAACTHPIKDNFKLRIFMLLLLQQPLTIPWQGPSHSGRQRHRGGSAVLDDAAGSWCRSHSWQCSCPVGTGHLQTWRQRLGQWTSLCSDGPHQMLHWGKQATCKVQSSGHCPSLAAETPTKEKRKVFALTSQAPQTHHSSHRCSLSWWTLAEDESCSTGHSLNFELWSPSS